MPVKFLETDPPATEAALQELEKALGHSLPADYRAHLQQHNGGRPEPDAFRIHWHDQDWAGFYETDGVAWFYSAGTPGNSLVHKFRSNQGYIPEDTLAIAHNAGRDLILLGYKGANAGKVMFWAADFAPAEGETPDYRNVGLIANSFNEFLEALF